MMRCLQILLTLILLAPPPAAVAEPAGIFSEFERSDWAFPNRVGMRCHENTHSIRFSDDRRQAVFDWAEPMINYLGEQDQQAIYDVVEYDARSITLFLNGETRVTDTGAPVVWILRLNQPDTYCWDRTDWSPGRCTNLHVRCQGDIPIS